MNLPRPIGPVELSPEALFLAVGWVCAVVVAAVCVAVASPALLVAWIRERSGKDVLNVPY